MLKIKRTIAFIIDIIFVGFLVTLIFNSPLLKDYNESVSFYQKALVDKTTEVYSYDLTDEHATERIINETSYLFYDTVKVQCYLYLLYLVVHILYFVLFAYFNQGRTLGCALMKIKVVNNASVKPNIIKFFIRSIFLSASLIYISPVGITCNMIIPRVLSPNNAFIPLVLISTLMYVFEIVLLLVFLINKKDLSIQDYVAGTKVVEYRR